MMRKFCETPSQPSPVWGRSSDLIGWISVPPPYWGRLGGGHRPSLKCRWDMVTISMLMLLALFCLPQPVSAHDGGPNADAILDAVGLDQRLEEQVPLALPFRDETGRAAPLGSYFRDKPVVLALTYFHCPNLCPLVLEGMAKSFAALPFTVGEEFDVITVSIDPAETPADAAAAKATYLAQYGRPGAADGWHFLTGDHTTVDTLAAAVGFRFAYDAEQEQYAHAAGIIILTPSGKIARYFYGLNYAKQDLRLGLVDAGAGKVGSPIDQLVLRCFHYDPETGKYGIVVRRVMQIAGLATVLMLGGLVGTLVYQEKKHHAFSTLS